MRLIDADALKENAYPAREYNPITQDFNLPVVDVSDIDDAPTIDLVKHGRWTKDPLGIGPICSSCSSALQLGMSGKYIHYPYCMWCGAKMDLDGETT